LHTAIVIALFVVIVCTWDCA